MEVCFVAPIHLHNSHMHTLIHFTPMNGLIHRCAHTACAHALTHLFTSTSGHTYPPTYVCVYIYTHNRVVVCALDFGCALDCTTHTLMHYSHTHALIHSCTHALRHACTHALKYVSRYGGY